MINISFGLSNPFTKTFKNLGCKWFKLSETNVFELELLRTSAFINFSFEISFNSSQCFFLSFGLLGYNISASIYDAKLWD